MILLLRAADPALWSRETTAAALARLPSSMRQEIRELRRRQDRQARILGRLLLRSGLGGLGLGDAAGLRGWTRTPSGRPFLEGCRVDWNISHTDGMVVCALSPTGRVGVDVERRAARDIADLRGAFRDGEWAEIAAAPDPELALLRLWTAKEAALKADGRGLTAEPRDLDALGGTVSLDGRSWRVLPQDVGTGWVCALATDAERPDVRAETRDIAALLAGLPVCP